ncbi:MAG: hypothetical protein L0Y72_14175 [Gemmataceae bacterium]|nr:hypothetical protein [Gemmataceae bacterium]MCI0740189.1 hypothetical protein [Gemmataceae bacterium]
MGGDQHKKLRTGQRLPGLPAKPWNNFLAKAAQPLPIGRTIAAPHFRSAGIIDILNNTGSTRAQFNIVGLGDPMVTPATNVDEWRNHLTFEGVALVEADHANKFAILLEPLQEGSIGKAVVSGVVQCRMEVTTPVTPKDFAKITTNMSRLQDATSGPARILWIEGNGQSEQWATVRLPETVSAASTFSGALLHHNIDQSINDSTWTTLAFNAEPYDTDSYHDNSTNNSRLTIASGLGLKFNIFGNVLFNGNSTGIRAIRIAIDGGGQIYAKTVPAVVSPNGTTVDFFFGTVSIANHYIELQVLQTSGGALNVITGNNTPQFGIETLD